MMWSANEIRKKFLAFFESKGHKIVPSAPLVIKDDPTLMFTNAGMNQFKDYFLGNKKAVFERVADTQKCLRVSGKHNDLEEVGVDAYHHTLFEMLGNWSFGNYFKQEAIAWSWELLTEIYKLPKDRLYASVFEGDANENLPAGEEELQEWKKYLPEAQIVFGNKKDNFWEMGDIGPCGPCSEIHIDLRSDAERKEILGKELVNKDHPQVIEIWNNVFIQFNRKKDGSLEALPAKHVDTGMGLERLVRALQNKTSNYDTDVFQPYIKKTESLCNLNYGGSDSKQDVAFRVIADHIRAICFAIADGQLPGNAGAAYVIRRILRRAVRYYYSYLHYQKPLLHALVPVLANAFEEIFPEVKAQEAFIAKVILEEENSFLHTLGKGLHRIEELMQDAQNDVLNGEAVFELYDTYGFPPDLTRLVAHENNLRIDEVGFEKAMQAQKERSRAATTLETDDWQVLDGTSKNIFVGYDQLKCSTLVTQYRKVNAKGKSLFQIVLKETPFYAESGGQVGDKGVLLFGDEKIEVFDTKKENNLWLHFTNSLPKEMNAQVIAKVNIERRKEISVHHSATHLLHAALRQVLGKHVAQKGSLVNEAHLRFDFSHIEKISIEDLQKIENIVNEKIRENVPVVIKTLPKEEAMKLGAMALFGEKYGEEVRVVIMEENFSIELCGGTHIGNTGELGYFKIISESAIAAGVRRIEALSGKEAEIYLQNELAQLQSIKELFKNPKNLLATITQWQDDKIALQKDIEKLQEQVRNDVVKEILLKKENIGDITFIGAQVSARDADDLKKICFALKTQIQKMVMVLCAQSQGKAFVCILVDDALSNQYSAKQWIKDIVSPLIKGGGGGQDNFASAGGQDTGKFTELITEIRKRIT